MPAVLWLDDVVFYFVFDLQACPAVLFPHMIYSNYSQLPFSLTYRMFNPYRLVVNKIDLVVDLLRSKNASY